MNERHHKLTKQLNRLANSNIGIREAALLFAMIDGVTIECLNTLIGTDKNTLKGRINALRTKKLIQSEYNPQGLAVYRPSPIGKKIITNTLA